MHAVNANEKHALNGAACGRLPQGWSYEKKSGSRQSPSGDARTKPREIHTFLLNVKATRRSSMSRLRDAECDVNAKLKALLI
jgi:hypothetical protein